MSGEQRKPLPQRYIGRQDLATLKTIEIIGRKRYKKLLDAGLIVVDYNIQRENRARHTVQIEDLRTTVRVLSSMTNRRDLLL